jgi:hypothetical protein
MLLTAPILGAFFFGLSLLESYPASAEIIGAKGCTLCVSLSPLAFNHSVKSLVIERFFGCSGASTLTFETGSEVSHIAVGALFDTMIEFVAIPLSFQTCRDHCVVGCSPVSTVIFALA